MNLLLQLELDEEIYSVSVEEIPHRHQNMCKASFKNGYENIFYTDVETGKWIEEDLGFTALAATIGKEMQNFLRTPYHVPKLLTWHNQYVNGAHLTFGFFVFMHGSQKIYQIFNAGRKYLYTLTEMDNEEWQMLGNANHLQSNIDHSLLQRIMEILPIYSANVK